MNFRLIYSGPLPSGQHEDRGPNLAARKHRLRKLFHRQLRELWKQHPDLRNMAETRYIKSTTPPNMVSDPGPNVEQILTATSLRPGGKPWIEHIADDHQIAGGRFVPLVREKGGFTCALEVLFLRRDNPGNLISNGGDIDNRVKVLLDGLRMPQSVPELGGYEIDIKDEDPFFCLLEDDKLVTGVSITTDRLIVPKGPNEALHDVHLVIHVTVVNPSAIFAGGRML
jgi:hypothetical protein